VCVCARACVCARLSVYLCACACVPVYVRACVRVCVSQSLATFHELLSMCVTGARAVIHMSHVTCM